MVLETVNCHVIDSKGIREEHPQKFLVCNNLLDYQGEHYRDVHNELKHEVARKQGE
jgi:hypothetical protein